MCISIIIYTQYEVGHFKDSWVLRSFLSCITFIQHDEIQDKSNTDNQSLLVFYPIFFLILF